MKEHTYATTNMNSISVARPLLFLCERRSEGGEKAT